MFKKLILSGLLLLPTCLSVRAADKSDNAEESKLPVVTPTLPEVAPLTEVSDPKPENTIAPLFDLSWFSINAGGASFGSSTNYEIGYSVGQPVAGSGNSTNYNLGIGFWYGSGILCTAIPGDVNASGTISLGDVINLVNYYFDKNGPSCLGSSPGNCWTPAPLCRGDVNGSGSITLGDVIHLVNFYFDKNGPSCLGSSPGNCWTPVASQGCCLAVP